MNIYPKQWNIFVFLIGMVVELILALTCSLLICLALGVTWKVGYMAAFYILKVYFTMGLKKKEK